MSCDYEVVTQKRGDTFYVEATYCADGTNATNLTDYTINSQVRDMQGELVSSLTVTKAASQSTTGKGKFTLQASTSDWPIATLIWDIEYIINGVTQSTETIKIKVVQDVTQTQGEQ